MISSHDRSGYFGASDVSYIVGNWNTKSFYDWWLVKLGLKQNHFENIAMNAGTHLEHRILDSLNIPDMEMDKQIIIEDILLRINLDGNTFDTDYEVKTYNANKPFKVPLKYRNQVLVQMYGSKLKKANIAAYGLTEQDYKNYFLPIDKSRLSIHPITYDETFIYNSFLPNIIILSDCLRRGVMPCKQHLLKQNGLSKVTVCGCP